MLRFQQWLLRLRPGQLWLLSLAAALLLTETLVSIMEYLLLGQVSWDYWVTGVVASLFVAGLVGGMLVYFIGVLRSETDQLNALGEQLTQSEAYWRFVLEGSGDAVWDWNLETDEVRLTQAGAAMFGYDETADDVRHMSSWFARLSPADQARWPEMMTNFFRSGADRISLEYPVRCKDGSWKWILTRGMVARRNAQGRVTRLVGVHTDIDMLKRTEAALAIARDEAVRADAAKTEFLSRMSHELRTPLNAVLGFGYLLADDGDHPLQPGQREAVEAILQGGEHLLELINEVLDMARIESGKLTMQLEPVPLQDMLDAVCAQLAPLAEQRGIAIELSDGRDLVLRADDFRLRQVVLNLLSNAIKYNREGGTIRINVRERGGHCRISVTDTGDGIPPESMPYLFQMFERLGQDARGVEGTGLGLALVKRLIEAMHGRVGVESTVGQGSTFWVELPLERVVQES